MSQHVLQADTAGVTRLTQNGLIPKVNRFLETPWFVALVSLLTAIANLFGAELIVYSVFILFGIYIALFGRDFLPLMSIVISCYIAPSVSNNPGREASSIFYPQNGGIYLLVLFLLFLGCVVFRLVKDQEIGGRKFLQCKRRLLPGVLILGAGYLLAGAFSGRYFENGIGNLMFASVQFLAVFVLYWFFSGAVHWDQVRTDYFSWVGLGVGLTACCEIVGVYIANEVIVDSIINTGRIASGWGNANNIGCMVAMMVPFAVDLARRSKRVWVFGTLAVLMVTFTCFTCSRTSILVAVVGYIAAMILAMKDPRQRKPLLIFNGIAALLLIVLLFAFNGQLEKLFEELRDRGIAPRMRDVIYPEGIKAFLQNPIFGESFYPSTDVIYEWSNLEEFKAILPARWHNTVIQLLASCGIVGLGCYSIHRIQTVKLFWEKRHTGVLYTGLALAALLVMSLLDCHFFNVGPTLFYSMGLAFAEKIEKTE